MSNVEEILRSEYSQKFDEIRKASMVQSFFKYGPARKNYVNGNCNALASMENCVKKYQDTGNTEYLTDAANYLMLEFCTRSMKKRIINAPVQVIVPVW